MILARLLTRYDDWLARAAQADSPDECPHPAGALCDCPWDTYVEDRERGIERRRR